MAVIAASVVGILHKAVRSTIPLIVAIAVFLWLVSSLFVAPPGYLPCPRRPFTTG